MIGSAAGCSPDISDLASRKNVATVHLSGHTGVAARRSTSHSVIARPMTGSLRAPDDRLREAIRRHKATMDCLVAFAFAR